MIEINYDGMIAKLEKAKELILKASSQKLESIVDEMKSNIVGMGAQAYSPTWQAAKDWKGGPYFQAHKGYLQIIEESPISVEGDAKGVSVRFGHIPTLDQLTVSATEGGQGFPYWRLFEYGSPGIRQGSSSRFMFGSPVGQNGPVHGFGRRGEGYMKPIVLGKAGNRGVMPVHLFGDSFNYYKPKIAPRLEEAIKKSLRTIQ